jgi:hypothetical protein
MRRTLEERIEERIAYEPNTGCHLWTGHLDKDGYGQITVAKGVIRKPHRVRYEMTRGPIPNGLYVLHKCDTPACVNPDHLFLGTQKENIHDAAAKGRRAVGERHPGAKLRAIDVKRIRERLRAGHTQVAIAKDYGISQDTVSKIKLNRLWKEGS